MSLVVDVPAPVTGRSVPAPAPALVMRCGGLAYPPTTCGHTDDPDDAEVHRSADSSAVSGGPVPHGVLRVLDTPGAPLESSVRTAMEARLVHDFSRVRVHTDADAARSARSIRAHAYTFGSQIVMAAGRFQPHTPSGNQLLTHELTHVVQQRGIPGSPTRVGDPGDAQEREANDVVVHGNNTHPAAAGSAANASPMIRRVPETWYRGEAEGVAPAAPGSVIHDFGDGLYLSDDPAVAAQYATTRAELRPETGRVVQATFERPLLGRVLDLTSDPRWAAYMRETTPSGVTFETLIRQVNENYWSFFQQFLHRHGLALTDFDAIVGPEYVRGGTQVCIRNPDIAAHVRGLLGESSTGSTTEPTVEKPVVSRFRVINTNEIPGGRVVSEVEVVLGDGLKAVNDLVAPTGARSVPHTFILRITTDSNGALVAAEASTADAATLAETLAREALRSAPRLGAAVGTGGTRSISPWVRGASWAGLALFAAITIHRLGTASRQDRPRVAVRAAGGFAAGAVGGYLVCNLVLGIETLGWSLLICGAAVGVPAGVAGESAADVAYDEATIDDDEIRAWVGAHRDAVGHLPAAEKLRLIFSLMRGWVSDDDVTAIVRILGGVRSRAERDALQHALEPHLLDLSSIGQRTTIRIALDEQ